MTKVKICGLSRPEDIEAVNAYSADYAGFVFFEKAVNYTIPYGRACIQPQNRLHRQLLLLGYAVDKQRITHTGYVFIYSEQFYVSRLS